MAALHATAAKQRWEECSRRVGTALQDDDSTPAIVVRKRPFNLRDYQLSQDAVGCLVEVYDFVLNLDSYSLFFFLLAPSKHP
jgi:hypothetical protein